MKKVLIYVAVAVVLAVFTGCQATVEDNDLPPISDISIETVPTRVNTGVTIPETEEYTGTYSEKKPKMAVQTEVEEGSTLDVVTTVAEAEETEEVYNTIPNKVYLSGGMDTGHLVSIPRAEGEWDVSVFSATAKELGYSCKIDEEYKDIAGTTATAAVAGDIALILYANADEPALLLRTVKDMYKDPEVVENVFTGYDECYVCDTGSTYSLYIRNGCLAIACETSSSDRGAAEEYIKTFFKETERMNPYDE